VKPTQIHVSNTVHFEISIRVAAKIPDRADFRFWVLISALVHGIRDMRRLALWEKHVYSSKDGAYNILEILVV
jgi:hypothetical protein